MKNPTLVFDLDGTLVDTAPDLIDATRHVLAPTGVDQLDETQLRTKVAYGARQMILNGLEQGGKKLHDDEVDTLLENFLSHYEQNIAVKSRPFPGVVDVLKRYHANGAKMVVCTNKVERLTRMLLKELGIIQYFSAIAGRDTLPVCKPDPGHLIASVIMGDGNLDAAIMIGDSSVDIDTAKAAGVPSIAVTFGYSDKPASELGAQALLDDYAKFDEAIVACRKAAEFTL